MPYTVPLPFQAKSVAYPAYHGTVFFMGRPIAQDTPSGGPNVAYALNKILFRLMDSENVNADALLQCLTEWLAAARAGGSEWRQPLPPPI